MKNQTHDLGVINPSEVLDKYLDRERLDRYFSVLMDHNSRINLVSRETTRADFDRLVAESLLPLDQIKELFTGYLDIGSGGGFPSLPILLSGIVSEGAIMVERTEKKARALKSMLTELGLKARVIPRNLEEVKDLPGVPFITLRLVKLDQALLTRINSLLQPGGVLVYYSRPEFSVTDLTCQTYIYRSSQGAEPKSFTLFQK
jgi:16S rRNA (guanine527-N7)-methyltransferase